MSNSAAKHETPSVTEEDAVVHKASKERTRRYYEHEYLNLSLSRLEDARDIIEDKINAVHTAYFIKGLSVQDISDIFYLTEPLINLLLAPPTEYEKDLYGKTIHPLLTQPA